MVLSTLSKRNKRYKLSDINLHDKFDCENQISKFEFRFEGIHSSFSKINKRIITIHSSKQKQCLKK